MDETTENFRSSEQYFGSQLRKLYAKLLPLFGEDRCVPVKLLSEYYNIQMETQLEAANCYRDIINVYYKQLFYFDLLENVIICVPYIERRLRQCYIEENSRLHLKKLIKDITGNENSYNIYFKHLSNQFNLQPLESIKIRAILKYFFEKEKQIKIKLEIGNILNEMIEREEKYIGNLKLLLEIFYVTSDGSDRIMGVMDQIYAGQIKLLEDLEKCEWDADTSYFIEYYNKHIPLFELYAKDQYLKSADVINTISDSLKHILKQNNADLYMCIKHLMPYSLFFEQLERLDVDMRIELLELKKNISNVTKDADDRFAVANIVRCNVPLDSIGNLIARGKATSVRKNDRELFLFEKALIITKVQTEKKLKNYKHLPEGSGVNPVVYYKNHILREFMEIKEIHNNRLEIKKILCEENCDDFKIENDIFKEQLLKYVEKL